MRHLLEACRWRICLWLLFEVNELTIPPDPNRNLSGHILLGAGGFLGLSSIFGWAITRKRRWAFPFLMAFAAALAIVTATRYTV
jgi:hypothetical protein